MNNASIGKKIRFYRESKKWTQEVFAEKIGLSLTYVGMIERGEKIPKLETFIRIANTLNVSADVLLSDVLETGYQIKTSLLSEKISNLSAEEREKVYAVVDAMINNI
ncbi:MAG: helix-turn-helix transcriptional regulator [Ruminococcaceae bacterium]|nr:helix-turn-helix transcriptional regulator [Oscillospiraceae bacterium]